MNKNVNEIVSELLKDIPKALKTIKRNKKYKDKRYDYFTSKNRN